jgi:hypothetical protein
VRSEVGSVRSEVARSVRMRSMQDARERAVCAFQACAVARSVRTSCARGMLRGSARKRACADLTLNLLHAAPSCAIMELGEYL